MSTFTDSVRLNFLFVDLYSFGRAWVYPESYLPYCMLRCVVKGSAVFFVNGEERIVRRGDIVYLPEGSRLSCHALEGGFEFYSIRFVTSVHYEGGDLLTDYYHVPTVTPDADGEALRYFEQIYKWVRIEEPSKMFRVRGYLELLAGFVVGQNAQPCELQGSQGEQPDMVEWQQNRMKKASVKMDTRIQLVVDHLMMHPTEQYTIHKMSEMAGLSESRFRTLFHQQVGKKPLEYLNEIRIMRAARKLLVSGDNISDIAYSLGFHDVNYFIRLFKKHFCVTPRQYRESAKE